MKTASSLLSKLSVSSLPWFFMVVLPAVVTLGCGSSPMSRSPVLSGNTSVTVMVSSTANDQLPQFDVTFTSLALTNQAGKTVSLLSAQQGAEFIHLNGTAEPLVTVSVPQDVYTAATAETTVGYGAGSFVCVSQPSAGELQISFFAGDAQPPTVTLPSPITITGTAMGLLLDLQVSQSATFSSCNLQVATFTITPTFNLTSFAISPQPTSLENGKASGIDGQISSVNISGNSFSLVTADGAKLSLGTSGSTVYQGIPGLSALVAGMAVDMDEVIQSDGSLLATRVAVEDADPTHLSVASGPVLYVAASVPVINLLEREQQGYLFPLLGNTPPFSFGSAIFQISGQFTNLENLPFTASFNAGNMVAGQNVHVSSHALTIGRAPTYVPATIITLMSQTINGTVSQVSNEGGFTTYTVALPPYDLFPTLGVQQGQTTLLTNPTEVVVYVDSNTQQLNTKPPAVGSVLRFNGLVFNDNGTLRMDCAQLNDGVTE
jgi:hypothetical protein